MENSKVYSVWKPCGITSYDVIRKIKRNFTLSKIGHCGTLDPFAEGVLLICTGKKVKDASNYMKLPKTYIADIIFGSETDTLDSTGLTIKKDNSEYMIKNTLLKKTINKFIGTYKQSPPFYSAKKINGIKMYELARKGIFVRPRGSNVSIHSITINSFKKTKLTIKIECGAGMYVRSLARDIAYDLGTYAYVDNLSRIKVGNFDINNSISYNSIGSI